MPTNPGTTTVGTFPGGISGVSMGAGNAWHYNPPKEHLVAGQLQGLMNPQGRYIGQARQTAMELANARGQANSSYAAGAAERAAIDAALPIASQDSETLTRIGLSNAGNSAQQSMLEQQLRAQSNQGGGIIVDTSGARQDEFAHDLQMQRERLAFEGEQQAYGRQQENSMGMFDLYGNMATNDQQFGNQRQLGFDQYGFQRGLNEQGYGFDQGRMGSQFGYNAALARQAGDLGMRNNYFNYGADMANNRASLYNNVIMQGMNVPEFMANPEAFYGFAQSVTGGSFGAGSNFWNSLFGGGG